MDNQDLLPSPVVQTNETKFGFKKAVLATTVLALLGVTAYASKSNFSTEKFLSKNSVKPEVF